MYFELMSAIKSIPEAIYLHISTFLTPLVQYTTHRLKTFDTVKNNRTTGRICMISLTTKSVVRFQS